MQHQPVRQAKRLAQTHGTSVARSAAWFSIVLGVIELAAPHAVARAAGLRRGNAHVVRLCGLREIATGIGLLRAGNATPWLWGRVAGDLLDARLVASLSDHTNLAGLAKAASAVAVVGTVAGANAFVAQHYRPSHGDGNVQHDYSERSGFPNGVAAARGAARHTPIPEDVRTPKDLRAWVPAQVAPAQ